MYAFLMILLSFILCLRYGQGTDYFSYYYIYNVQTTFENAINNPYHLNCEVGFGMLLRI